MVKIFQFEPILLLTCAIILTRFLYIATEKER